MKKLVALTLPFLGAALLTGCPEDSEDPPVTPPPTTGDLAAPPAGQGVQFAIEPFDVEPGNEVQNCYFYKVSDLAAKGGLDPAKPLNLNRVQLHQSDGSHHMNIFRVRTIVNLDPADGTALGLNGDGECFKSPNWADWPLIANTQIDGQLDWQFPEGVANVLQPDEIIMVQSHFVNANSQETPTGIGEVTVNFWHAPTFEHEMGTLFATQQSIRVCESNPNPSFFRTCQSEGDEELRIIGANGHFHSRGKNFKMFAWDGVSETQPAASDLFYESLDWAEPPMARSPELDVVVPPGGGVWFTCEFEWRQPEAAVGCEGLNAYDEMKFMTPAAQQDCCYTFGPIVEKNEHCNAFVYYYPKRDDVFCN